MINEILKKEEEKMKKTIEHLQTELMSIRSGKASISLLENIHIDYYGTMTPLPQVGTLHAPDARTLTVKPWDKNIIPVIEKSLTQSTLGFNPSNDGNIIHIPIPAPSEEQRKEYVKLAKKVGEDNKIAIRNIRRDGIQVFKQNEKDKNISEDESHLGQKKIQEITDDYIKKVDEVITRKEKEIMEV